MRVLFASSELFPYSKSGGLADVAHSLPLELHKICEIINITPMYKFIDKDKFGIIPFGEKFILNFGDNFYEIELFRFTDKKIDTLFVYNDILCEVDTLYGYKNDSLRFGIFSYAISKVAELLRVDIAHLNDWHTALAAFILKEKKSAVKSIFTIHNLAYQGVFKKDILDILEIPKKYFNQESFEFYGKVNLLKAGIAYSNRITTVSPTYAKEIQTKEHGCGLDGFLSKYKYKLEGILNGIDTGYFNPKNDKAIKENYDVKTLNKKEKNRNLFYENIGIKNSKRPLFIFIGRLVEQKGISLIIDLLKDISKMKLEFIILGEGEKKYEENLMLLSKKYKNIHFIKGYDEDMSHKMYASANFLVMPSLFEPCGLNQMIAARYGVISIVHSIGGLKDTVFQNERKCAMGVKFDEFKKYELLNAVKKALSIFENKKNYEKIVKFDMKCDFSFAKSAKKYIKLYKEVL